MVSAASPQLSVIVAIVSDTTSLDYDISHLRGCLNALHHQFHPPSLEIIVPYHEGINGIDDIKQQYPNVNFMFVNGLRTLQSTTGSREHHDELRARGIAVARGNIIALTEDHAHPDASWCTVVVKAHEADIAGVGGAIENGIDRPLNWAVYFCDFGKYQNPVPGGPSLIASDANVAYKRSALESISTIWQRSFNEIFVNSALIENGGSLTLSPDMIAYQYRENLNPLDAIKERYIWGRSYAGTRCEQLSLAKRFIYALLSPLLPIVLVSRMTLKVINQGRCIGIFLKVLPLTIVLTISWSLGELVGYITAKSC